METKRSALMIWTNSMQLGFIHSTTKNVLGVILSGSPYSVYDSDAPHVDPTVFELDVPVLGICYGLQEMAWNMKGKVAKCDHREYGFAQVQISKIGGEGTGADALFAGLGDELQVRTLPNIAQIRSKKHLGLDVPRRPTVRATSGFPHHRPHEHRTVCCNCAQFETLLWHPVPPRSHTFQAG